MKQETERVDSHRRGFLSGASCGIFAALATAGLNLGSASALSADGSERSYPLPAGDSAKIDQANQVILVRSANRVYAFSLSCPHENTALRWREQDDRFQCPRHESKYRPDGAFLSGRATRNMDRFAIRLDGKNVVVDVGRLFRSDRQKAEWDAAAVTL